MRLLHLTAVGPDVPPATLEFTPRLTVIYGASETGKSYIIDALNYMMGAKSLRDIPEASKYRTLLLGLTMNDGVDVTLARSLRGGRIALYEGDIRSQPDRVPDRTLLGQHSKENDENISYFLLADLGVARAKLRKNVRNSLQAMSLRNIAHLCLIDEGKIQARTSPVESGVPTSRTAERSAFKLLLEGDDDSALIERENQAEFRRVNRGQVEVLNTAIQQVREHIVDGLDRPVLLDQLARVNDGILAASAAVNEALGERDALVGRRSDIQAAIRRHNAVISEAGVLVSRFSLLDQQYSSDLDRLAMVKEAGTLLGYFKTGVCVFCGAMPEHQNVSHATYESVRLSESVDAEIAKTLSLRQDLGRTIEGIHQEESRAEAAVRELASQLEDVTAMIDSLDQLAQPFRDEMTQLIARRSELERQLGLRDRVDELEALLRSVEATTVAEVESIASGVTTGTQYAFSTSLRRLLRTWRVPGAENAYVEFSGAPDVYIDQRPRADRGKGMRAVLHAGFSVALCEYCLEHDLPHPGFVALDTPVLTYRDAEGRKGEPDSADELLSPSVAEAFYGYLCTDRPGQVVVIENQTPPDIDGQGCSTHYFSGTTGVGRSGFYPST